MASRNFTLHRIWAKQATIGFLGATTPSIWSAFVGAFEHKLRNLGWIDGSNIAIEYGWAHGNKDRYAAIAQKFVDREVDIIVTSGTGPAIAAKNATSSIPIVVAAVGDPVGINLVKNLKRPGGNITGLSNGQTDLVVPRLLQLRKVVPRLKRLGVIGNRASKNVQLEIEQIKKNAGKLGIDTVIVLPNIERPAQITPFIKGLQGKADALFVCTDPFITTHHVAINIAAAAAKLPTMHAFRDYVEAGGLMSYGPDFRAMFANAAALVDRILRGADAGLIPIEIQATRELVINHHTAKALGLTIHRGVSKRATIIK